MAVLKPSPFAALLKRHRARMGLTQEELADRARLSVRGISDLERGINLSPRATTVHQLADALGLSEAERSGLQTAARGFSPQGARGRVSDTTVHRHASGAPLVGRLVDLDALDQHLTGTREPLLVFAGEPGIGKTRLLESAIDRAAQGGIATVSGGCQRGSGQQPFAPLAEALLTFAEGQPQAKLRNALQGCTWLVRLLPELAEVIRTAIPVGAPEAGRERRLVFSSVVRFLKNAAGPAGIVLVLDDLQWAGVDALSLLAEILRAAPDIPLRAVCAYRSTEVDPHHPLSVLLGDLAQAQLVTHRRLEPLGGDDAKALLRVLSPDVDPRTQVTLLDKSGGVPFFLVSWAAGLQAQGPFDIETTRLPWTLAQSIRQRVTALPPETNDVLGIASIIGREVPLALLLDAGEAPDEAILGALDTAEHAGLIAGSAGHHFHFLHDVIREVIEADLGSARRILLHRRVGRALERLSGEHGTENAALAWHFLEGDLPQLALKYTLRAGQQSERMFAQKEAEVHYCTAVKLARNTGDRAAEAQALERLGAVLTVMSRWTEAIACLDDAAEICRALGDGEARERLIAHIAWAHLELGTPRDGIARIEAWLQETDDVRPSVGRAQVYSVLSDLYAQVCRYQENLQAIEQAADIAAAAPDGPERLRARAAIELRWGRALLSIGRTNEGWRALERTIPLAEAARDLYTLNRAYNNIGYVHRSRANYRAAHECYRRALEVIEPLGDPLNTGITLSNMTDSLLILGEWEEATATCQRSADKILSVGSSRFAPIPLLDRGRLLYCQGNYDEAEHLLDEGIRMSEASQRFPSLWESFWLQEGVRARAEMDLRRGRAAASAARLERFLSAASWYSADKSETEAAILVPVLARAYLELGKVEESQLWLDRAAERLNGSDDMVANAHVLTARGALHATRGEYEQAIQLLERATSLAASVPFPYLKSRALMEWARALEQIGDTAGAESRITQAAEIFERLGARRDGEMARQELARFRMS